MTQLPSQYKFNRVSGLDAPSIAAQNLIQGHIFNAGLNPAKMTLKERQKLSDVIKAQAPQNAVVDTLLDVALDPLVWLGLALSVPFKIPRVDRLFSIHPLLGAQVREGGSLLQNLKVSTGLQSLSGTSVTESLVDVERAVNTFRRDSSSVTGGAFRDYAQAQQAIGSSARQLSDNQADNIAVALFLNGSHKTRTIESPVITFRKRVKKGPKKGQLVRVSQSKAQELLKNNPNAIEDIRINTVTQTVDPIVERDALEGYIDKRGLRPITDSLRTEYNRSLRETFGTAEAAARGEFELDENALLRIWRGARNQFVTGSLSKNGAQLGILNGLLHDGVLGRVNIGALSKEKFLKLVRTSFSSVEDYHPLNLPQTFRPEVGGGFRLLSEDEAVQATNVFNPRFMSEQRVRNVLRPGGASVPRGPGSLQFNPDDLDMLNKELGGSELLTRASENARGSVDKARARGKDVRFFKLGAQESYIKATDEAARTIGLYRMQPTKAVLQSQREKLAKVRALRELEDPGSTSRPEFFHDEGFNGKTSFFSAADGDRAPLGGFSNADVIRAEGSLIKASNPAKDHLKHVLLPMVTGRARVRQGVLTGSIMRTKHMLKGFLDGGLKDLIDGAGLKKLASGLDNFANKEVKELRYADRELIKFVYGSTLGANIGSVLLNLTQPLFSTSSLVRFDDLAKGYSRALTDVKNYGVTRKRLAGFSPLVGPETRDLKRQIIRESFGKLGSTLELSDDALDSIERIGSKQFFGANRTGPLAALDKVNEFSLKLFEKAEFFNRLVTARAVESAGLRTGVDALGIERAQLRAVQETQFSSSVLNTPLVFLQDQRTVNSGGFAGFFNQPLFRQFLTFSLRAAEFPFQSTRFGGAPGLRRSTQLFLRNKTGLGPDEIGKIVGKENAFSGLQFAGRGLVTSLVAFHAGRNFLGVDLTPATLPGAAVQGFRSRDSTPFSPFPAPPALTVPVQFVKALATGEVQDLGNTLPLFVPGGIAISRALKVAPSVSVLRTVGVQRRFADYENPRSDGRVPVFAADGRLVEFKSKIQLALEAAGLDLGRFRDEGQVLQFIGAQRDLKSKFTTEYLNALKAGNTDKAKVIERTFAKRFGYRLRVSKAAVQSFVQSKEATRVERAFSRLSGGQRAQTGPAIEQQLGGRLGVPAGSLGTLTNAQINQSRMTVIDEETLGMLKDAAQRSRDEKFSSPKGGAFGAFEPF